MYLNKGYPRKKHHFVTKMNHCSFHLPSWQKTLKIDYVDTIEDRGLLPYSVDTNKPCNRCILKTHNHNGCKNERKPKFMESNKY